MADWQLTGLVRRRASITLDGSVNGSVSFDVWSANHKWIIDTMFCSTSQAQTVSPYPQVITYVGGMQTGVAEGASWIGNQTTLRGPQEIGAADTLTVQFNGGVAGSVATVVIEGRNYLWR